MSTAYPPRFIRYMLSSQKERDTARSSPITPGFYGNFPSALGLYYAEPGNDYLSQRFTLSSIDPDGAADDILYQLVFHKGPGLRQMTLYSGPASDAPMVVCSNERRFGSSAVIRLPGTGASDTIWSERLHYSGIGSNAYTFEFDGDMFAWTEDTTRRPRTRRLRKKTSTVPAPGQDSTRIIATWTEGSVPNRYRQLANIRFMRDSDGEAHKLSDRFMLLIVATALAICQQGAAVEGTMTWHEEKMLERGAYQK